MTEAATLQAIRLDLGREPSVRLFRNNVGLLRDPTGRAVRFGLHPGSGDLIGWRTITITAEHVGQRLAVFASIEVKTDRGRAREDQIHWARTVYAAGGLSGVARNPADARMLLGVAP
jgi:hypothetical protein